MGGTQSIEIEDIKNVLTRWKHRAPKKYAHTLIDTWGPPTGIGHRFMSWEISSRKPYIEVKVMDEYIKHDFPAPHHDFVYTTISIKEASRKKITALHAGELSKVTGSIIVDLLKQEVTARCGGLTKNDVTLSFVLDVVIDCVQDIMPVWFGLGFHVDWLGGGIGLLASAYDV